MSSEQQFPDIDLTPLVYLGLKLGVVALVVLLVVGLARSWWNNRRVAAPPAARGGQLEPLARVLRGASRTWDDELVSAGLFVRSAAGLQRPRIVAANQVALKVVPLPGTMPRWGHPATVAHLSQIADHQVIVGQVGASVVIKLAG